jgi:hypothetical protein
MWVFDKDYNRWITSDDKLRIDSFEFLKQELSAVRFYSKCLSGATYLPVNDLDNIYDILGNYQEKTWYISVLGSQYSNTLIPSKNPAPITATNSEDYYTKYNSEYGLTLKNLFTPDRLIKDSIKNYIYVDVATNEQLDDLLDNIVNRTIDGVKLKNGHRVLVKDQKSRVVLSNTIDPDTYFEGSYQVIQNLGATIEYEYYNEDNGIYLYQNNILTKEPDLDNYDDCIRFSVSVKMGDSNREKQYHLVRLKSGYYPTTSSNQPIEFLEKKNWMLRNRVDYNNLFEINYYDIIKNPTQSYFMNGITYSIPERTISVGEFGVINNFQEDAANIINNKYKVNLRSISQTSAYYWICGDDGILLKVRKHDFNIERIEVDCKCPTNLITTNLKSVSFFDDLNGVAVGDLNTVLLTTDGGFKWERIKVSAFDSFYYNKVIFYSANSFYIGGNAGIFIEFRRDINGWKAFRKRISRFIDDEDEYLLVDNINDILYTNIDWNLNYSFSTQSIPLNKDLLFITTDDSKIIAYDINKTTKFNFIYLDFNEKYGDIINITRRQGTNNFYFTGISEQTSDSGLFSFDITDFQNLGVDNEFSNTVLSNTASYFESDYYSNETFDYNGDELLICGNESLLLSSTYGVTFSFNEFDPNFEDKLKSKMLFLDYDMASKLNFFRDNGDYRLPDSVDFILPLTAGSYVEFSPLVYSPSFPNFMTQSEINWFEYWRDRQMTFEYLSNSPMTDNSKVLISPTFSYSTISASNSVTNITSNGGYIINLAPNILDKEHSRYNGVGLTISAPTASFDLYLYDYLMIYKVDLSYPVVTGDVIRLESSVVTSNFVVNKIVTLGSFKYIYMFTEFNQNIITELSFLSSVNLINLNKFNTLDDLEWRFNHNYISNGYEMSLIDSDITINAKFNNLTSYYNLATNIDVYGVTYSMIYTDGFMKFGYTPTYNLLDYLESINDSTSPNPAFIANKEYFSMPDYRGIPITTGFTTDDVYIDYNYGENKIFFGENLEFEWNSIFLNTFIDVNIYSGITSQANNRLLVTKKYKIENIDNLGFDAFVIEFHKKVQFLGVPTSIDLISRRKLSQISEDLQYLNNIGRPENLYQYQGGTTQSLQLWNTSYNRYERELNYKINTDSYAKIFLSDSDTVELLSAVIYTDYKNEISMNITRLESEIEVPILNTSNFGGNLFVSCSEKHGLNTGDAVILEFNGGTGSSQQLNQQYFGYHPVVVQNEFNFIINIPYGTPTIVGNDTGFVRYVKKDPFLNYQPVDLIDVGVNKRGKVAIELNVDNNELVEDRFRLINVDFSKYRFRLVDGLNVETLAIQYPWIYEAEISGAVIGFDNNGVVWYKGTWECGRWFGGTWQSGSWLSGDWYGGIWNSKLIKDNWINVEVDDKSSDTVQSIWFSGRWYDGIWNNGTWVDGRWYGGTWNKGIWFRGIWNDGTWNDGRFSGGIWVLGTWNKGIFNTDNEPSYWLDGTWNGGDFENGMWYNGTFQQKLIESRFGSKAYNSRTATWHGGKWIDGSFHSRINLDDSGEYDVSETHKYSIWYTGQWFNGNFYGGVAYNIDFKSGTWHGGILEDIQVIGFTGSTMSSENYFVLNGIFKFNIGDEITIIDNEIGNTYSNDFGSNDNPIRYKVLNTVEDNVNKFTNVYVDKIISSSVNPPVDLGLRIVSRFRNCNWKSGIWTNGIYESGQWEGGIWYNGVFENNGVWL